MRRVWLFTFVFLLLNCSLVLSQPVTILNLDYNYGNVSVLSLIVNEGYFNELVDSEGEYTAKMISCEDKILYELEFGFDLEVYNEPLLEWFDEQGNQIYFPPKEESKNYLDKTTKEFILPYFENLKQIDIYKFADLILTIDADFNETCTSEKKDGAGNNQGDKQKKSQIDGPTEVLEPILGEDKKNNQRSLIYILIGGLVIIMVIVFLILGRKKQEIKNSISTPPSHDSSSQE